MSCAAPATPAPSPGSPGSGLRPGAPPARTRGGKGRGPEEPDGTRARPGQALLTAQLRFLGNGAASSFPNFARWDRRVLRPERLGAVRGGCGRPRGPGAARDGARRRRGSGAAAGPGSAGTPLPTAVAGRGAATGPHSRSVQRLLGHGRAGRRRGRRRLRLRWRRLSLRRRRRLRGLRRRRLLLLLKGLERLEGLHQLFQGRHGGLPPRGTAPGTLGPAPGAAHQRGNEWGSGPQSGAEPKHPAILDASRQAPRPCVPRRSAGGAGPGRAAGVDSQRRRPLPMASRRAGPPTRPPGPLSAGAATEITAPHPGEGARLRGGAWS